MKLSVKVKLSQITQHPDDDIYEDSLMLHPLGCPASMVEVVIEHDGFSNPKVIELRRDELQLDRRLLDTLVLSLWHFMRGQPAESGTASEIQWDISDLRPSLQSIFYRSDAGRIERQLSAHQALEAEGPSVLASFVD